ncbi:MAG: carboxymuconolactone decarboxylase family protein [Candidatus Methanomethylophilaceae archaeon]|nr:carboxymuconolactone decarboxylase family protein [Candidatus Methanomethylophilaceae archaeon]MDD3378615.1 carboxymuconolactone decarboxylase family protein [Candidatus Methanomethylophilaceae archaeon]MDY0224489.1 carboxymuconolactone decarboxylase family protein [Candidatus Methanomethylophilaceae archaeon]
MSLIMLGERDPKVLQAMYKYRNEVFKNGAVSVREKELLAMALSSVAKCEKCFEYHADAAIQAGATPQEILEIQEVVMYMTGPSAMIWSEKIDEYVNRKE